MRTPFAVTGAIMLILAGMSPCFGMMSVGAVSKERAEEMGIEIRTKPAGPKNLSVEIEFKLEGKLRHFDPELASRVEMRVMERTESLLKGGKAVINAALHLEQPSPRHVQAGFTASREQAKRITVLIVVGAGLLPAGAYEIDLKDFVDAELIQARGTEADRHELELDGQPVEPPAGS